MKVVYHKKYSPVLGREMEFKTYGDRGHGVIVFPSQDGRFYDYQDFDMVASISGLIERGHIRLICVDSIDKETWSNLEGDEGSRIRLHEKWHKYIVDELIPSVRRYPSETFIATGCSMGGYHAANFFFRRPDLFDTLLSLSGLYNADYFFPNYQESLVYDNSPLDFLRNMPTDHPYIDLYRNRRIVMCVGQGNWEEELLDSTRKMEQLLKEKQIPAWIDYWGHDVSHDWAWWRIQVAYFMKHLVVDEYVDYEI